MVHFSSFTGADSSKKIAQHIRFENVQLFDIDEKLTLSPRNGESYTVIAEDLQILIQAGNSFDLIELFRINNSTSFARKLLFRYRNNTNRFEWARLLPFQFC